MGCICPGHLILAKAFKYGGWEFVACVVVTQSCLTLCGLWTAADPGSSVHSILQARILEWAAISFSRGSCQPRDRTHVSCTAGRRFTVWATREESFAEKHGVYMPRTFDTYKGSWIWWLIVCGLNNWNTKIGDTNQKGIVKLILVNICKDIYTKGSRMQLQKEKKK